MVSFTGYIVKRTQLLIHNYKGMPMFSRKNRTDNENIALGAIFVFLGGYIGVATAFILNHFVNSMTGNSTEVGISFGFSEIEEGFVFLVIVCSFIFGTFLATKFLDKYENGYIHSLVLESILLFNVIFLPSTYALWLAALAMGLQNGMTTYITWGCGKVRTTHVTGTSTDIGFSIAEKDKYEIGFTIMQALMYLFGGTVGYYASLRLDHMVFATAGVAILAIVMIDAMVKSFKKKAVA